MNKVTNNLSLFVWISWYLCCRLYPVRLIRRSKNRWNSWFHFQSYSNSIKSLVPTRHTSNYVTRSSCSNMNVVVPVRLTPLFHQFIPLCSCAFIESLIHSFWDWEVWLHLIVCLCLCVLWYGELLWTSLCFFATCECKQFLHTNRRTTLYKLRR